MEVKYRIPGSGEALTRLVSQLQQFTQYVSQGQGREVILWTLKGPENVAKLEAALAEAGVATTNIRFVYGVEGLFQYLTRLLGD